MNKTLNTLLFLSVLAALTIFSGCGGGINPASPGFSPINQPFNMDGVSTDGVTFDGSGSFLSTSMLNVLPGSSHLVGFDPPENRISLEFNAVCSSGTFFVDGANAGNEVRMDGKYLEWKAPDQDGNVSLIFDEWPGGGDGLRFGIKVGVSSAQPVDGAAPVPITREITFASPINGEIITAAAGELLVKLREGQPLTDIADLRASHDYDILERISPYSPVYRIRFDDESDMMSAWKDFRDDSRIMVVEPNYMAYPAVAPDDPDYSKKHEFPKIDAELAWDLETGSEDVWVAVIDTGVDRDHPDLADNVVPGMDFILGGDGLGGETPGDGIDNNNDGIVDQNVGHGTHVAGIIAEQAFNNEGACGIAYNASILPLRIFPTNGDTGATFSSIIEAVNYAVTRANVRVISMSIGTTYESSLLQDAIDYAWNSGIVLVAAAANANTNTPYFPAAHDNVVAVAAINKYGIKASFSNYGSWIDISAYGTGIYSTFYNDQYAYMSGTSMATPLVSGCFALLFAYNPNLTNEQAVDILKGCTDDVYELNPEYIGMLGSGLVNPYLALDVLSNSQPGQMDDGSSDGSVSGSGMNLGPGAHD